MRMDIVVRTIAKWLAPFIWLYGIYILLHGHITPGGSFSGGAIVAAGAVLLIIAYGTKDAERVFHEDNLHFVEAFAGLFLVFSIFVDAFFRDDIKTLLGAFNILSAGHILSLNMAGGLMVLSALIMIIYVISRR